MCDIDCANLIDLSLEENASIEKTDKNATTPSENTNTDNLSTLLHFVSPPRTDKRVSLDNNPFDVVEKLADCKDDPFDIVEREACLKAQLSKRTPSVEVKLGNLLSLSDDNLLECGNVAPPEEASGRNKVKDFDLDSESPPITMMDKFNSGTDTDSTPGDSAEMSSAAKMKKAMEYRKRLLKLSVTNAAFNSPTARRSSVDDVDAMGTPVSSTLNKTPFLCEYSLAAESPLKFVDDDIMSEEPPALIDADKNFEADLEMLKIPMLSELESAATHHISPPRDNKITETSLKSITATNLSPHLDLETLKREETNNNHQDINSLICDLKSLLNSGDLAANGKQLQASSLLESLSCALTTSQTSESPSMQQNNLAVPEPQPMKRQGTFDLDLKENTSTDELANQPLVSEMPNCMVSSSATYDGETAEDKQELNLPEIDPPSPQYSDGGETTLQHDVNDIVEQLSKLLIHNNSGDGQQGNQQNPTFIVVMPSNSHHNNSISAGTKQKPAMVTSFIEHSSPDDSPELNIVNVQPNPHRRRSQSLSLHDKVKIVQIPFHPPTPKGLQKQHSIMDDSPPVTTTPPPKDFESEEFKTPEFKTPARMIRRNSYSSGTPYTATVGMRRTGIGSSMTQTLDTHVEGQQQQQQQQKAIVRPMPTNNLQSFKPDLKKKHKANATESIMKSSGPLKATIPVKKVAPMLKTSPPTPDNGAMKDDVHNNSKVKLKMPTTPMASGRISALGVPSGYPNACSTPSLFTSPMKRTTAGTTLQKPRYSYLSATPNAKPVVSAASTAAIKRRTISEFKAKSPLKSRLNTTAGTAASSSASSRNASSTSRLSTSSSRLSTSSSTKLNSKTTLKPASNTAAVKPTGRISSRVSSVGTTSLSRNKENKHP